MGLTPVWMAICELCEEDVWVKGADTSRVVAEDIFRRQGWRGYDPFWYCPEHAEDGTRCYLESFGLYEYRR